MSNILMYDISRMTGQTLEHMLIDLVEHPNWKDIDTYSFYKLKKNAFEVCFEIKIERKTGPQTGNGKLVNSKGEGKRWKQMKKTWNHKKFPENRNTFLNQYLGEIDFGIESAYVNVLLLFEIARRKTDESNYPLKRKQTKQAIEKMMENNNSAYEENVMICLK